MATAEVNRPIPVEIPPITVTLTLSLDEALTILALARSCQGSDHNSPRRHMTEIFRVLQNAGIKDSTPGYSAIRAALRAPALF